MNLCYLYSDQITYPYVKELLEAFDESETLDITSQKCTKEYDVYIVDLGEVAKETTTAVRNIFKEKNSALIYMISSGTTGAAFYQLVYLLKVRSVITQKQDVKKVIGLVKSAYATHIVESKSMYVGRFISEAFCYMIFKNKKLYYASDTLMENFECTTLKEVEQKICSKLDLEKLLCEEGVAVDARAIFDDTKLDIVKSIRKNNEHLVMIDRYDFDQIQCNASDDLATRLKFIDFLKDRLMETSGEKYSLITIKINNFKKIGNLIGKSDLEMFISRFIQKSKEILKKYLIFSEYNQDFFVATFKDIPFEDLEEKAQQFYTDMQEFANEFKFKIDVSLYVIELDHMELGMILSILDSIRANRISKKEIKNTRVKYIGKYDENMSDKEMIELLLDSSFINDTDLKLVNVYKGMLIDSPTKILKKDRNAIYVVFNQIQGAVMSIEKKTILRSDAFEKDILASVAFVDRKRKIAKLDTFKVIENSVLYRDHFRVDFAKKSMAVVSLVGTKVSAQILDISDKSISLQLNKAKMLEKLINKNVEITFTIPTHRTRDGEVKIVEQAKVSYVECANKDACRVVCEFDPNSKNRNIIAEYVHTRQAEIIEELKKMAY